jgi:hypothetical protein
LELWKQRSNNKEGRRGWACSRRFFFLNPLIFKFHIFFISCYLDNLKSYESSIWSFTKPFSSAKTIKWHPKILSSKMKIGHMYKPTCPWPLSFGKKHILFTSSLIWVIFVTLDAPGEGLKNHFEFQRQQNNVQRFISLCPLII